MKFLTIILVCVLILAGCTTGKTCVSVGGSYDGAAGNVEYCYEPVASKEIGFPYFKSSDGNGGVMLTESQANKILSKFYATPKDVKETQKPAIHRLVEILKEKD